MRWLMLALLAAGPASAQTPEMIREVEQKLEAERERAARQREVAVERALTWLGKAQAAPADEVTQARSALEHAKAKLEEAKARLEEAQRVRQPEADAIVEVWREAGHPATNQPKNDVLKPSQAAESLTLAFDADGANLYSLRRRVRMTLDADAAGGTPLVRRTHALPIDKARKLLGFLNEFTPAGSVEAKLDGGGLVTTASPEIDRLIVGLVALMQGQKPAKVGAAAIDIDQNLAVAWDAAVDASTPGNVWIELADADPPAKANLYRSLVAPIILNERYFLDDRLLASPKELPLP